LSDEVQNGKLEQKKKRDFCTNEEEQTAATAVSIPLQITPWHVVLQSI
jgi:hypothetical protein